MRSSLIVAIGLVAGVSLVGLLAPQAARAVQDLLVTVTNTSVNPVIARDTDSAGRHPFTQRCRSLGGCTFSAPAGQRVVVQYISAKVDAVGCSYLSINLISNDIFLPCVSSADGIWIAQGPLTFYIEPGEVIGTGFATFGGSTGAENVTITGYTVSPP
jgi:hypothetical protein